MSERAMTFSKQYIKMICRLYGDEYDDRIEDSRPPVAGKKDGKTEYRGAGSDWFPGMTAQHKSLTSFQRELADKGIILSSSKIRKILITGGCWTTERSREIGELFDQFTKSKSEGGSGLQPDAAIVKIATDLGVSIVTVSVNLPYQNVMYKLENKSSNAKRCARYKERKRNKSTS